MKKSSRIKKLSRLIWVKMKKNRILEIKNLQVHHGRAEALKGVSIGVDEGNIVSIIGANGAGKTTLLRTISGLERPTSGEIWFRGRRIDGISTAEIVKLGVGHVPEGKMLFSSMTVLDNLKMGAFLRKNRTEINGDVEAIYDQFPVLEEKHKEPAWSLSGGQQQMLAIARALMTKSDLILLDEPSTGLSPLLVKEFSRILRRINREGKSILLVEQNARMALKLAQRAYLLETGYIVLEGDAKDLVDDSRVKKAYLGG
jgi:branched-chain amino acid transport system ATP-binding protein